MTTQTVANYSTPSRAWRPPPAALAAAAMMMACGSPESPPPVATVATAPGMIAAPTEADIPNDAFGASVRRGLYLIRFTPESIPDYARSSLRCTSCHQNDGLKINSAPLVGAHARYPRYMSRAGATVALSDRVNYCITRSLAGNALPHESREMEDILAYLAFISSAYPYGSEPPVGIAGIRETLVGDATRGEALFTKTCVVCHGVDGGGLNPIPALWGPTSYSIGASMAREERAASFIFHNMPQTAPGTLSPQDAFDLAAYVNSKPRPDSPGKELDWPLGGAPADTPYGTAMQPKAYRPPPLLPRANPQRAIVPAPRSVLSRATPR